MSFIDWRLNNAVSIFTVDILNSFFLQLDAGNYDALSRSKEIFFMI